MKGKKYAATTTETDPFSRFVGRLDYQIEIFAHHVLGCSAEDLTARIGVLYASDHAKQEFDVEEVPNLLRKTRGPYKRLREVESSTGTRAKSSPKGKVKEKKTKRNAWWYKLTKAQKKAIIAKRVASTEKTRAMGRVAEG